MARIPFEDDSRLTADNDMAVALNNARMDLQARTCVRLVPRKTEKDYVLFTDLGQNVECWNLFEPLPPKGQVLVNAGPSCLEPMKRPHKPKRVFSECLEEFYFIKKIFKYFKGDIEYVNHLYNCPKRRKPSPICPTGRLIMSKPDEYFERNLITTTTEKQLSNEEIFSIGEGGGRGGEGGGRGGNEEDYLPLNEKEEEKGKKFSNKNEEKEEEEDSIRERPYISISIEAEETEELDYSTITTELPTTIIATTIYPVTEIEEQTVTESNNIEEQIENSTELVEIQQTTSKTSENHLSTEMLPASTSLANLEEENNLLITSPDEEKLTTATPPQTTSSISTSLDTSLSTFETNILPNPTNIVDIPSSNKFGESLRVMGRQPYPLMMTLIRTTTTTTILPPTPEWVRSVEESFLAGEQLGGSGEKKEIIGEKPHGDGWRILSTIGPPSPMPIPPILPPFQPLQPFQPVGEEEKEIISKIGGGGGGSGGSNPLDPLPIKPGVIGIRNGTRINSQEEEEDEKEEMGKSSNLIENNKGPKQKISAFLGVIQLPPGAAINIKERTKITKLVERTKYIGPCGSACTYGDWIPQILNHFYTTERLEQHLMGAQGFVMEPSMGYLGKNQIDPNCTCIRPLYRLYSEFAKDHFLTSNEDEKNIAETLLGYSFERILGYCTKEPGCGAYLPLYRFYNAINKGKYREMHYYKTHSELAFGFEKIECYVWQKSSSSRGCPALTLEIQEDEEERRRENEQNKSIKNEKEENNKSFSDENIKLKRRRKRRKD
ncbi:unnamed protein product [Meloidogyne enterolobii]|uniref:Uncharacterized protein n=1 Tax=Meloidogyne enterolobii TaxID=390850 RepID=A0ACB0Y3C7_MELEN